MNRNKIVEYLKRIFYGKNWKEKELKKIGFKSLLNTDFKNEEELDEIFNVPEIPAKPEIEYEEVDSWDEMYKTYISAMSVEFISEKQLEPEFRKILKNLVIDFSNYKEYQIRGFKYNKDLYIFVPYSEYKYGSNVKKKDFFIMIILKSNKNVFKLFKVMKFYFGNYIVPVSIFSKNIINHPDCRKKVDNALRKEIKRIEYEKNKNYTSSDKKNFSIRKESITYTKKKHVLVEKFDSELEDFNEIKRNHNLVK